jgi:Ca2+-binding RTX toxin-like protein
MAWPVIGGPGADVFVFNMGSGSDIITDFDATNIYEASLDAIRFGAGIQSRDVSFISSGNDTVINLGASDTITLQGVHDIDLAARFQFTG